MSEPLPVIVDEHCKSPATWRSTRVAGDWLIDSIGSFGWKLEEVALGELELTLADGEGITLPSPPIQLEGFPGIKSLPLLAYARIPTDQLSFSRDADSLWLYVEVTEIGDQWSRTWADYVLRMGNPEQIPLGVGFAVEPGAVISTGEQLVRATWGSETDPGAGQLKSIGSEPAAELLALERT